MVELFLARLEGPGGFQKLVTLKMILPDVASDEQFVEMFHEEASLRAELSHPNLGQAFHLGHQKTVELYLAMELLSDQSLGVVTPQLYELFLKVYSPEERRIPRILRGR